MHYNLSIAADKINNLYSVQLILWISSTFMAAMSRCYGLLLDPRHQAVAQLTRDLGLVGICFIHLMIITASCHITSRKVKPAFNHSFFIQQFLTSIIIDCSISVDF